MSLNILAAGLPIHSTCVVRVVKQCCSIAGAAELTGRETFKDLSRCSQTPPLAKSWPPADTTIEQAICRAKYWHWMSGGREEFARPPHLLSLT